MNFNVLSHLVLILDLYFLQNLISSSRAVACDTLPENELSAKLRCCREILYQNYAENCCKKDGSVQKWVLSTTKGSEMLA